MFTITLAVNGHPTHLLVCRRRGPAIVGRDATYIVDIAAPEMADRRITVQWPWQPQSLSSLATTIMQRAFSPPLGGS